MSLMHGQGFMFCVAPTFLKKIATSKDGPCAKKMADEHEGNHVDEEKVGVTQLPLARVKRIAKSDPDLKTISAEAVFVIAKATVRYIIK